MTGHCRFTFKSSDAKVYIVSSPIARYDVEYTSLLWTIPADRSSLWHPLLVKVVISKGLLGGRWVILTCALSRIHSAETSHKSSLGSYLCFV